MNILVVRNDKLGDFITALPTMYVLKKYNPHNKVKVLVAPLNEALANACDFIDEVIVDRGENSFELANKIRKHKIDVSVTLFSNTRVAIAQLLAFIPKRIAPATKIAQIFYNKKVKQRRSQVKMAEFEYNLELAKEVFADVSLEFPKPLLKFEDADTVYNDFCAKYKISRDVICFHVGFGGSSDANWSLDEYEILIRETIKNKKYQVVMTFGPDENELMQTMQENLKDLDIVYYLSVDGLVYFAKIISNFELFVSTSTGTYHLASLVGTPTMTFFGDSLFASAARWKSIGDEDKQEHFMIPIDKKERDQMFEEVKTDLFSF